MAEEMSGETVVAKLGDREVLKNYCEFAVFHRAMSAITLFKSLGTDENQRRSIGLEILGNFAASLEDTALWFYVLKEWKEEKDLLFDLLDRTIITEGSGHPYSSEKALEEMAVWTIADLRREFGLPTDQRLLHMGWTERELNEHINALRDVLRELREALEMRTEDERVLVSAYNKVKHGTLAIAAKEYSEIGVSVMLSSRRGPIDLKSGKRKIDTGWIDCEDKELAKLVDNTVHTCGNLWAMLNLIYKSRFDQSWQGVLPAAITDWSKTHCSSIHSTATEDLLEERRQELEREERGLPPPVSH